MAATDARQFAIKNQACPDTFPIPDADGDLVSGAAGLDSEISKDGGTFTDCGSEAVEIATASGVYFLDLTNTEMNADCVSLIIKTTTTGAKTTTIVLYPLESGDIICNTTHLGGNTVTGRDMGASVRLSPGTGTGQVNLSSGAVPVSGDLTATMKTSVQTELTTYGAVKPTVAARTLDISATGEAWVDWANVGSPTTTQNLSATSIATAGSVTNPVALTAA